jgi:hypothetical protein
MCIDRRRDWRSSISDLHQTKGGNPGVKNRRLKKKKKKRRRRGEEKPEEEEDGEEDWRRRRGEGVHARKKMKEKMKGVWRYARVLQFRVPIFNTHTHI